jgi:DNA-binding CsgD family transcriptional regulator
MAGLQKAEVARFRAEMEFARSRGGDTGALKVSATARQLLDAARQLENLDDYAATETYAEAIAAILYAGRLSEPGALTDAAQAARCALSRATKAPRAIELLLNGIAERITGGVSAGAGPLRIALDAMCDLAKSNDLQVLRWMVPAFPILQESAAHDLWDEAIVDQLSAAVVRQARDAGALDVLPRALVYRAGAHLLAGEFATATTLIEEANSISASTDHLAPVRYHSLLLTAWRGEPTEAVSLIEAAAADGAARGEGRLLGLTSYAAAVLYNGLGRYEEAAAAAREACEYEDLGFHGWCLFELIEAATRSGDIATAASAAQRFDQHAGATGTDWRLGAVANARALVADDDDADELYTEAIERFERTRIAVHLARSRLHYGEWLRRVNRRVDARRELTAAHEAFTRMGAQAFAERTRRELAATGEKVRKQPITSGSELTAQEAQIARLAGDGLTNQEIGAQLFISTHTVEWHLRKVFAKLGIKSRRQLRTVSWAS